MSEQAYAQLTLTGVSIPGVGSSIDVSRYPVINTRFRVTRAGQPVVLDIKDVFILEDNRYIKLRRLTNEAQGVYTAEFATSLFNPVLNSIPTSISSSVTLYAANNGDVGSLRISWSFTPPRGGNVIVLDSSFKPVPYFIDFGDVAVGVDSLRKLNVRAQEVTRGTNGNERYLHLDTILLRSDNFRVVWKGTYRTKAPPVDIESGGDYRFDLICSPKSAGPISDVLTFVYEGGSRIDVMIFANTPSYTATTVLQILSPNGGESITPCQDVTVRWKGAIQGFNTHVEYSTDNGKKWKFIDSTLDSTLVWRVPANFTDSARIRVYQKQGASNARWLPGESSPATNLAFNSSGRFLSVAHSNGVISEWDIVTSTIVNRYFAEGVVDSVAQIKAMSYVGATRDILAVLDRQAPFNSQIQRFSASVPAPTARVDVDLQEVIEIGTDVGGVYAVVVGRTGGQVYVFDPVTLAKRNSILLSAPSSAGKLANGVLTVAQIDGDVVRIDPASLREISRFATKLPENGGPAPYNVSTSGSSQLMVIAGASNPGVGNTSQDQRTLIYDVVKNSLIRVIYREGPNSVGLTFNPSETFLTMGFEGQPQIRQYDIINRQMAGPITGMPGHSNRLTDIEYGSDGSTLASCSIDLQNNILIRRIITPERDASDGVFRIVPLDMSSNTITIGVHYIGTRVDTTVTSTICNNGAVRALFETGALKFNSWLSLPTPILNDTVLPGQCLSVQFVATLRDTGRLVDTLDLTACGVKYRVPILGTSLDRNLTLSGDMTDFGNVCIGDTNSIRIPLVRNNDPIDVAIDGVIMRKGVGSQFRIRGFNSGTTLSPNESLDVDILFVPRRLGRDTDEVVILYAGQVNVTRTIRVIGYGAGADIQLSHPSLAFIPEINEREVVIANHSANEVVLTSAVLPAGAPFTLLTAVPVSIPGNDSIRLRIRHDGGPISGNDILALGFAPCASSLGIRLVSYIGTATASAPVVSADPRGDAVIPITTTIVENVLYNGERSFEGVMLVNPRLFLARTITSDVGTAEILSQEVVGGDRQIRFRVTGSFSRSQEIARLQGPAGIAEIDSSVLTFDSTATAFGSSVAMAYEKGLLRILNPDPNRHILYRSGLQIRSVAPQPAVDATTISLYSDSDVQGTLTLSDQQGVIHHRQSIHLVRGVSSFEIDTRQLPPGVHAAYITADRNSTSTFIVVIR
ncbi:MAG: hypothetical protein H7X70_06035 [Candidatus Kapabacteria bacterium]|nr:hypothetical protein [Candidatus Kapabacteria bacterium]